MLKIKTHLVGGIFTAVIAVILLLLLPSQIGDELMLPKGQIASNFVPTLLLYLMLGLSILLIIQSLFFKIEHIVEISISEVRDVGVFTLNLLVSVILFHLLGFIVSMIAMCAMTFLQLKCKRKSIYITSAALIVVVYFSFTTLLNVPLP